MTEQTHIAQGDRVAKVIAQSGLCSRREAEQLISEGRVAVNGKTIDNPSVFITDHSIKVDGKLINKKQETRLWLLYKPVGVITTNKDPKNRKTVFKILPKNFPRVLSVGRLDFNTEGLLILTTNGALASFLEMPKNQWIRKYRARVFGKINHERLEALEKGISIQGIHYGSVKVTVDVEKESNSWLTITLQEGKNREIRNIMEHLGLQVNRLIRTSFGPFVLGNMEIGELREINKKQLESFIPKEIL